MGLLKYRPPQSSRMGILWTLATIEEAVLIEFGSMGHMVYADTLLKRAGVFNGCPCYTTHIDEVDIAMGNVERIEKTLQYVLKKDQPSAVFLLPSSIPEMIGVDLQAICDELYQLYSEVPLISFGYGGFQYDFTKGIEQALLTLSKELMDPTCLRHEKLSYNLLGSCSDLYNFQADEAELDRLLQQTFQLSKNCSLSANGSVSIIEHLGQAHINVVIRQEALATAKWLQQECGIPYIYGRPYGAIQTQAWLEKIAEILGLRADLTAFHKEVAELELYKTMCQHRFAYQPNQKALFLGGHLDVISGISDFAKTEMGLSVARTWSDSPRLNNQEIPFLEEAERLKVIKKASEQGILMASGELLQIENQPSSNQLAWPGTTWQMNPYVPFVGIRGAYRLLDCWVNQPGLI